MVLLSRVFSKKWIDSLRIHCKGGTGGNGLPKFGGVGGKGGNVYISPSSEVRDLDTIFVQRFNMNSKTQRLHAGSGEHSRRQSITGSPGEDAKLEVPLGIQVVDDYGKLLADLDKEGIDILVARGGTGGGLATNWLGAEGQNRFIRLDLKLIADVGLVGFPNAGKSTLLRAISRAKPKIASYPFTTIKPNLGHIYYTEDGRELAMADLPGLIEGASCNVGMGHRFLKHVERTRLLLFVIDVNGFRLNQQTTFRTAFETIVLLNRELELYKKDLVDGEKPVVCLINKMDSENVDKKYEELMERLEDYEENVKSAVPEGMRPEMAVKFREVIPISAKFSPKSVAFVKKKLKEICDELDETERFQNQTLKSVEQIEAAIEKELLPKTPRLI